jgi:hypothetical protein
MPVAKSKERVLLRALAGKFSDPNFFYKLPELYQNIKYLVFNGQRLAIKDTRSYGHGMHFEILRKSLLLHQKAAREGKINTSGYVLRAPRVFGTIKQRYLVMSFVEGKTIDGFARELLDSGATKETIASFSSAWKKLQGNIRQLFASNPAERPQIFHFIAAGTTNPKSPEKGNWVFYLPYDID